MPRKKDFLQSQIQQVKNDQNGGEYDIYSEGLSLQQKIVQKITLLEKYITKILSFSWEEKSIILAEKLKNW